MTCSLAGCDIMFLLKQSTMHLEMEDYIVSIFEDSPYHPVLLLLAMHRHSEASWDVVCM